MNKMGGLATGLFMVMAILLLAGGAGATAESVLTYAEINGQVLDISDPVVSVSPRTTLSGRIDVQMRNDCSSCIIPSVGINSWERTFSDLGGISGNWQWHTKSYSFSFIAPNTEGDYYIAAGHGPCYAAADLVYGCYGIGDPRRGRPGGGDDLWDRWNISDWEAALPGGSKTDFRAIKIKVTTSTPPPLSEYGTPVVLASGLNQPTGVTLDANDNVYFTEDAGHVIKKIPTGTTNVEIVIGSLADEPQGIAVDNAGNIYYAQYWAERLMKLPSGSTTPVTLASNVFRIHGVAVDSSGNVFFTQWVANGALQKLPSGSTIPEVLVSNIEGADYIDTDDADNVYFGGNSTFNSWFDGKLMKLSPDSTTPTVLLSSGFPAGYGIAVDKNGNIYYTDRGNPGTLKKLPSGLSTPITILDGLLGPPGVAVDSAGNVYFAEYSGGTIKKLPFIGGDGIVAEYHFDGDAKDSSGNGNDGTVYGAAYVDGVRGKALSFDGVDDYVDAGKGASLNVQNAITIEAWVNPARGASLENIRAIADKFGTGSFSDQNSWSFYDTASQNPNSKGFEGAVFDGRYIYFVPLTYGQVTRYDTSGSFTDSSSWSFYDTAAQNSNSRGFVGGEFDGRYIYFVPSLYGGQVTRYDTTSSFTDENSWSF